MQKRKLKPLGNSCNHPLKLPTIAQEAKIRPNRSPCCHTTATIWEKIHLRNVNVLLFLAGAWFQCCQMVYFQTKNPDLGKFWKVLQWKTLVFFSIILSILRPNVVFYGHLLHLVVIWYIFSRFGMLYREKSGSPAWFPSALIYRA
jgi:hypothetical protein